MEIRHLKLIKAIAEEGSITKAIDKLHLTQSALSHQLREAEYQLGTPIFTRTKKKMTLTKAGEKIYATASEVLEKLESAETQIKKMIYGETGEIKLSAECYSSYHWLPSVMKQFHQLYPNVDLQLVMSATHYPLQKLLAGELDIAITTDPIKDVKLQYTELFQDEMVVVVPAGHEWASKKFVAAEDFSDACLIIHSLPMETVTVYEFFLKPAKVSPKKVTAVPLTEAAIEMVKADMGVMVLAKWALKNYINDDQLRLVKVGRNGLKRKHYIATFKNKTYPKYFTHFITFLQKEIAI
ncbi:LysR family transcriptional regulator [Pseudochryseolinea flava]|uniref:LysR family transcriptional regulator n=1 Tax=Pseudochryseolinea flava TaxID=2059302 RepID=A0A364Y276_9BACT|nr:LysR family transcriptional regulator [Pseudochryseolinea flava]RAW00856.1 LysR family transcriptional regulator [Pseudochryseolinea flava]